MVTTIKAIETVYPWPDGPRYRSRLEARYAVFFDSLNLRYEYEPEGYELWGNRRYLPDFWLPDLRSWIEIKGDVPTDDEENLMYDLVGMRDSIGHIFYGLPGEYEGISFCWDLGDSSGGQSAPSPSFWTVCTQCESIGIHIANSNDLYFDEMFRVPLRFCSCAPDLTSLHHPKLTKATRAARQARFEHGEHGR